MTNFIDDFMRTYGPEVSRQLSSNLNVDQGTVQKLIPELTPLILGGLKKQKDDWGGVEAARSLGKKMNIDPSIIMKIIPALAPVVLAALTKKRDTGKTGIGGIGSLLDASGDGKIIDDIAGFILKGTGGTPADMGKNILGSILGGMTKKK